MPRANAYLATKCRAGGVRFPDGLFGCATGYRAKILAVLPSGSAVSFAVSDRLGVMRAWGVVAAMVGVGVAVSAVARGQAPRIAERGDAAVRDDTIYRLAVDSAAYPGQSTVVLFNDGVVRMDDARATRTWRTVVQVLRDGGVKAWRERQFTYNPRYETATINWMRVVKPDGTVISAGPSQVQEGALGAAPGMSSTHNVIRASLSGVAPGTIVDICWTDAQRVRFRDFFQTWQVTPGATVRRSRLLIDVPDTVTLRFVEHNLNFARRESVVGRRLIYEWATSDVPWVAPEDYAPPADSNDQGMVITVSTPGSWADIGHWYAGVLKGRLRATSRLKDTVARVVAHATTREDSIKAVRRWVTQDVRSVAAPLGSGNYRPRAPEDVMSTGFGDSKDKTALLVAALGAIRVDAYPVLINASEEINRDLPVMATFNHEIAVIKQPSGYDFVDPSSDITPPGELPLRDEGRFALVVHPDGQTEQLTTPQAPATIGETSVDVAGVLDSSGTFTGRAHVGTRGAGAVFLRAMMRQDMDSTQRAGFLREAALDAFPNATGDSLVVFDGKDHDAEPTMSFLVRAQATQRSGTTDILTLEDPLAETAQAADELEAHLPRRMPIDAARVLGPVTMVRETRVTLPVGWRARLPQGVTATSLFGEYESTYRQDGRELILTRRTSGTRGIVSKDHIGELIAWLRAMAKDRVPYIIIDHA